MNFEIDDTKLNTKWHESSTTPTWDKIIQTSLATGRCKMAKSCRCCNGRTGCRLAMQQLRPVSWSTGENCDCANHLHTPRAAINKVVMTHTPAFILL